MTERELFRSSRDSLSSDSVMLNVMAIISSLVGTLVIVLFSGGLLSIRNKIRLS